MSDFKNLDQLLKESFDGFTPQAPNVWSGISQQVASQAAQVSAAGKVAAAIKSASLVTKAILILSIPVMGTSVYLGYQYLNKTTSNEAVYNNNHPGASDKSMSDAQLGGDANESAKVEVEKQNNNSKVKVAKSPVGRANNDELRPEREAIEYKPIEPSTPTTVMSDKQEQMAVVSDNASVKKAPPTPVKTLDKPKANRYNRLETKEKDVVSLGEVEEVEQPVIPNVFTPDGNGENDVFRILIENESKFLLHIYDSEGKLVFESESKDICWDGKVLKTGQNAEEGWYTYILNLEMTNGKTQTKTGKLQLIR